MIHYKMNLSEEKKEAVIEIALKSKANIHRSKVMKPILCIVGIMEVLLGVYFSLKHLYTSGIIIVLIGILLLLLAYKSKAFLRLMLKKAEKLLDNSFRTGIVEYIFDTDGVQIISQNGNGLNYWSAFGEWGIMGQYIYVKRKDKKIILVDKNDLSKDEIDELTQLLTNIH